MLARVLCDVFKLIVIWSNMSTFNFNKKITCKNDRNDFCYLCGDYIRSTKSFSVSSNYVKSLVEKCYPKYEFKGLNSEWAPDNVFTKCTTRLSRHLNGKTPLPWKQSPTVWRRFRKDHSDCYFCLSTIPKYNRKSKEGFVFSRESCITRPPEELDLEEDSDQAHVSDPGADPGADPEADPEPENQVHDLSFDLLNQSLPSTINPNDTSFHTGYYPELLSYLLQIY